MTDREREILRMALIYMAANLSDVCQVFETDDPQTGEVSVNGHVMPEPTEREVDNLITSLQG